MTPTKTAKPDVDAMFDQFLAAGVPTPEIGQAMGLMLSDRMIAAYRNGVPLRQSSMEGFMKLWAEKFPRKPVPTGS